MNPPPKSLLKIRRRWNVALYGGLAGRYLGGALLVAGTAVVIGKSIGQDWTIPAAVASAIIGLGLASRQFQKSRLESSQIATLLDLRQGGTGQILLQVENGEAPADWQKMTRPRPALKRVLPLLAPGVVFFGLTFMVPLHAIAPQQTDPLSEKQLAELQEFAATLEETVVLDKEVQTEVQERMQLLESADARNAAHQNIMREALDRMESRLEEVAQNSATKLEEIRRSIEKAMAESANGKDDESLNQLAELAKQMQKLGFNLEDFLTPEMLAALQGALTPEMLQNLDLEALAKLLSEAALDKLKALAEQGLLNPAALAQMARNLENFQRDFSQAGGT